DTIARIVDGPPPVAVDEREPRIPKDLAAIITSAIAHAPSDCYPSARELAEDLHRYQAGRLVAAHRYSAWTRIARWLRARRTTLAVTAAACVVIAATVGFVVIRGAAADDLSSARAEVERAAGEAEHAASEVRAKEAARAVAEAEKLAADAE